MTHKMIIAVAAIGVLTACENGFRDYYLPVESFPVTSYGGEPRVSYYSEINQQLFFDFYENGFAAVGISSFTQNAAAVDNSQAIAQAKSVGAQHVVLSTKDAGTYVGSIPITTNKTITTNSTTTANVNTNSGTVWGTANTQTSTSVPSTTYYPYAFTRNDYSAVFFAPMADVCVGAWTDEASNAEKAELGTNKALKVLALRTGGPAYNADLLVGDLILSVNGEPPSEITSIEPFKPLEMVVSRNNKKLVISLITGPGC